MLCSISNLKPEAISRIQDLETKLGQTLVALTVQPIELAHPSEEVLNQIKQAEEELGVVLLAVKK